MDFYPAITENGQSTRRQFLQMYMTNEFNPTNLNDRQIRKLPFPLQVSIEEEVKENQKILETAEQIRMIRYGELNNAKHFNEIAIRQEKLLHQQEQEQVRIEASKLLDEKRLDIDFIKYFESLAYNSEGSGGLVFNRNVHLKLKGCYKRQSFFIDCMTFILFSC